MVSFAARILTRFPTHFLVRNGMAWSLGLALLLVSGLVRAEQAGIQVKISPTQLQLGEKVTLTIQGEQLRNDFDKLDWRTLAQQFALYDVDISSERIRVQLYPIVSGTLRLPALQAGVIRIPETMIAVAENPEVKIAWQRPKQVLYPQQNVAWLAEVNLRNAANSTFYEAPHKMLNTAIKLQLEVNPIQNKRNTSAVEKVERLVANYQLNELEALREHEGWLYSPAVVVKNTGQQLWRFFDAPLPVVFKPLPTFLPIITPVGQLQITSPQLGFWHTQGTLSHWVWQVHGQSMDGQQLRLFVQQMHAKMKHDDHIEWLSDSQQVAQHLTANGLQSELTFNLPYRMVGLGLTKMPALQVGVFNPLTGKLENVTLAEQWMFTLPQGFLWVLEWLVLLAILIGLLWLFLVMKQAWLNWRLSRAINQASSRHALWLALQQWQALQANALSVSVGKLSVGLGYRFGFRWAPPTPPAQSVTSFGQWQAWVNDRYGVSVALNQFISLMNNATYAQPAFNASESATRNAQADFVMLRDLAKQWSQQLPLWRKSQAH